MENLFIDGKSMLDRSLKSSEFDRLAGKVMRSISTGTTHWKQEFGEEESVEDLFIEGKSMPDRSLESSEFGRLAGKVMRSISTGTIHWKQEFGEE